jgi:lipoyl(octanoyl) transferase
VSTSAAGKPPKIIIRHNGLTEYADAYRRMQDFTAARTAETADEIWFTEHPPVITLGTNAKHEHIISAGDTPVVQTDRGGQVTWHGPGQLMVYLLLDLKRLKLPVKSLVQGMELAVIQMLADYGISANCEAGAPGVYVSGKKIASLGIRVKRGYTYHGMAINISNSPDAFAGINPCGYSGLDTVRINDLLATGSTAKNLAEVSNRLLPHLQLALKLTNSQRRAAPTNAR